MKISKFTDDTKIASQVNTFNNIRWMQRILNRLIVYTNKWNMDFNVNKYKYIYREKKFWVSIPNELGLVQISKWRKGSWSVNV